MTDSLISQLLDFGALGIFAGFLIWQHLGMQKRLDGLTERFQTQLDKINTDHDTRIEKMHEDNAKGLLYHQEQIVTRLTSSEHKLDVSMDKMDDALTKIDTGLNEMRIKYAEDRAKK